MDNRHDGLLVLLPVMQIIRSTTGLSAGAGLILLRAAMMVMVNNTSLYGRFGNIIIILYRNILVEYSCALGVVVVVS